MKKLHLEMRNKLCLFLVGFENINMYSKGTYLFKIHATMGDQKCNISRSNNQSERSNLLQKDPVEQYSKNFMIKYQNEKVDLNQTFILQTPLYKYTKEANICIRFCLYKAEKQTNKDKIECTKVASTMITLKFTLNSIFEYCQCIFQEPMLSSLAFLIVNQPIKVVIQIKNYKHSSQQVLLFLKKEVKRLRYNNYLLQNKFRKIIYSQINYRFTLPKMFVNGSNEMIEVETNQQQLLNYLILYQTMSFTPEIMNYELTSICQKNDYLHEIFRNSCISGTVFINRLKMDYEDKQSKKLKQYISKQEHKMKFCQEYKSIIRQKLKLLEKQFNLTSSDQSLNNMVMKHQRHGDNLANAISPNYPIIVHEVQRLKTIEKPQQSTQNQSKRKIRYIFLLAHGFQGCVEDLVYIANGLKRKYRKSKYLILKSYQNKMEESLVSMFKVALQQVNAYLKTFNFQEKEYRIVMIGHSMGGLILRYVASSISNPHNLYAYISLGTPHLGYLQGIKFLIKAGISLLSNISNNPCLSELSNKDSNDLHQCLIYKLSASSTLSNFKKIILVASVNDKYVPWHSARLQNYSKDVLKQYNFIEKQMIESILGKQLSKVERIDRIQVEFKSSQNSNMDKFIGRSSHIKFLNDIEFIEIFIYGCLAQIFED